MTQPKTRITQLDGIRAIAILAVFLNHALFVRLLWSGVDLFFVLSGFLITGILMEQKKKLGMGAYLGHFYERRARRILLPYFLLLLLTSIFVTTDWLHHAIFYLFLMNLVKTLHLPEPNPFGPLWSLAVEEQFYLFWPFVVFWLEEKAMLGVAIGLLIAAPVLRGVCSPFLHSLWPVYELTPFRMDCLAAGAILAVVWHRRRSWIHRFGQWGLLLSLVAGSTLIGLSRLHGYLRTDNSVKGNVVVYELTMLAGVGMVLWALSGRYVQILQWAPLRYLGRISYSVYLIHVFAIGVARRYVPGLGRAALVAAAGTLAYAALSWHLLEQPLLGSRPKEATMTLRPALDEQAPTQV